MVHEERPWIDSIARTTRKSHAEMTMDDRPKLGRTEWRKLSAEISEEMRAAFALDELDLPTEELRAYFQLPEDFRIHKIGGVPYVSWTSIALAVYGEWERATTALNALNHLPLPEYRVPNESTLRRAVSGVWFLAEAAGRRVEGSRLQSNVTDPRRVRFHKESLEGGILRRFLDMPEDEHDDYFDGHERHEIVRRYMADLGNLAMIWAQGASEAFTREDCVREIDRYAKAIFALPGFAPWNDRAYPYG
ncbi:hypothetical protein [Brevibacterium litoralis]|uniref:hypothetical protein n=1 Tax=Brevibacterium litoralis TaxID=3138935 RepID=UPI0032ECD8BE